jgi:hypothetical protein
MYNAIMSLRLIDKGMGTAELMPPVADNASMFNKM